MPSPTFLARLEALGEKGLTMSRRVLAESADVLEDLAVKAVKNGGRLSADEERQLRKIYTDYQRASIREKQNAVAALGEARVHAEIRDDFFNGALGHIGKTADERALLRMAVTRPTMEAGGNVTLLGGKGTMSRTEFDNLKSIKPSEAQFLEDGMKARWQLVQDHEKSLMTSARREGERDAVTLDARNSEKSRAAQVRQEQQAQQAQQAREAAEAAAREDVIRRESTRQAQAIIELNRNTDSLTPELMGTAFDGLRTHLEGNKKLVANITDLNPPRQGINPNDIPSVMREIAAGRQVTEAEFSGVRSAYVNQADNVAKARTEAAKASMEAAEKAALKASHTEQLMLALSELRISQRSNFKVDTDKFFTDFRKFAGKDGADLIKGNDEVARLKQLSPKEIFEELAAGRPVTNNEYEGLVSFFKRNFDKKLSAEELEKNRAATPPAMPIGGFAGGAATGGLNRAIPVVTSLIPYITRNLGGEARAVSRNTIWEWENVGTPGFWTSYGNNLADFRGRTWAGSSVLALTAAVLTPAAIIHNFPEGTGAGIHNNAYTLVYDRDPPFEQMDATSNRIFIKLTRDGQASKDLFARYAYDLTGIKVDTTKDKLDLEKLREIAVFMSNLPQGRNNSGKTEYDVVGFQYALAFYSDVAAQAITDMRTKGGAEVDGKKMSVWEYLAHTNSSASVSATYQRLIGEDGNTPEFVAAVKKFTISKMYPKGIDISMYQGSEKSIPPGILFEIAVTAQTVSSSGNVREQSAFFAALNKKIDPSGFTPDFGRGADKPADGKKVDYRELAVDSAAELLLRTLNSEGRMDAFTRNALGNVSLPPSDTEKRIFILEKLEDVNFARSPNGRVLTLQYMQIKPSSLPKAGGDEREKEDWAANVKNRITQIKAADATRQQTEFSAGAQTALDQGAATVGREALANERAQGQAEARQSRRLREIRESFAEYAKAIPELAGKEKDMEAAFDTVNASGAFNRAVAGHDPYTKFGEELMKRGIPQSTAKTLVEQIRAFEPSR
jgi:hypothetical protein